MPWKEIFDSVSSISTWLGLAGLLSAMFFFTVRLIAQKKIFKPLTRAASESLLRLIVWLSFVLVVLSILVAGFAGVVGYILPKSPPVQHSKTMRGTMVLNGKGIPKIDVKLREALQSKVSNDFGDFEFKLNHDQLFASYHLEVSGDLIQDSTFQFDSAAFFANPTLNVLPVKKNEKDGSTKQGEEQRNANQDIAEPQEKQDKPVVTYVNLTGSVRDAAGQKLAGVKIRSAAGDSTVTDPIGEFALKVKQTKSGETRLHFWQGNKISSKQVKISSARITLQFK